MASNPQPWTQGGESAGVGIGIRQEPGGRVMIEVVAPGGSADRAGIQPSDELYQVDGFPCRGADLDAVTARIRGPVGSPVVLHCGRGPQLIPFTVTRAAVGPVRAPERPAPENAPRPIPWLRSPPQPAARAAPNSSPRSATKLERRVIRDPQVGNCAAFEYVVPEGWESQGRIHWDHDSSMLATVQLEIGDPASGAHLSWLRTAHFSFTPNPPGQIAIGGNWMGGTFLPPPQHPAELVQTFWSGGELAHLRGRRPSHVEDRPKLAQEFTRGQSGWRAQAVRLRYEYEVQGTPWLEDVSFALNFAPQMDASVFNWNVQSAISVRAPREMLEERESLFHALSTNAGFTCEWLATYQICRQLFQQRMREWVIDNQRFAQQLAQYRDHISRLSQQMHAERMESFDRIAASQREYLGGVETYRDPHDGRGVYLPAGYKDYWVNQKGEILLYDEVGHDPNIGDTDRWSRMERIHPLDARW